MWIEHKQRVFTNTITLSDEALAVILDIPFDGMRFVRFQVANLGNALDQFQILGRPGPDAPFDLLYDTADFAAIPAGLLLGKGDDDTDTGDLGNLATGKRGWFLLENNTDETIRIKAARASGANTALTIFASGS